VIIVVVDFGAATEVNCDCHGCVVADWAMLAGKAPAGAELAVTVTEAVPVAVALSKSRRCECDSGAAEVGRAGTDWSDGCHVRGDGTLLMELPAAVLLADEESLLADLGGDFEEVDAGFRDCECEYEAVGVCGDND
jgi:hypothetical protein